MIDVNELRKGTTFELDGNIYKVLEYSHHKPGRGKATIRVEVRDLRSGTRLMKKFNSGDTVQDIRLSYRNAKYMYSDGELYHFMDVENYEQPALRKENLGEATKFLQEEMEVKLTSYQGEPLDIELPTTVDQAVVRADPSIREIQQPRSLKVSPLPPDWKLKFLISWKPGMSSGLIPAVGNTSPEYKHENTRWCRMSILLW